ncbi:unnamed protein product [Dicrocoelium dendriticum]|nr:unnamed protein product [Dicrocoelium dendriticum]
MRSALCLWFILLLRFNYSFSIILVRKLGSNSSITYFNDEQARFGPGIKEDSPVMVRLIINLIYSQGRIFASEPIEGCVDNISLPINHSRYALPFICLIKRGNCTFDYKARAAHRGGYVAAVIYNHLGDDIFPMASQSSMYVNLN